MSTTYTLLEALRVYIDARIEEEFAGRELDADGYTSNTPHETKTREDAWNDVLRAAVNAASQREKK